MPDAMADMAERSSPVTHRGCCRSRCRSCCRTRRCRSWAPSIPASSGQIGRGRTDRRGGDRRDHPVGGLLDFRLSAHGHHGPDSAGRGAGDGAEVGALLSRALLIGISAGACDHRAASADLSGWPFGSRPPVPRSRRWRATTWRSASGRRPRRSRFMASPAG